MESLLESCFRSARSPWIFLIRRSRSPRFPNGLRRPTARGLVGRNVTAIRRADAKRVVRLPRARSARSAENVIQSERYDRLLETNGSFRQARMRRECGPITDPELRQSCLDSFAQYEPAAARATSTRKVASSKPARHTTHYVGSSTAPRHHPSRAGQ